MIRHSTHEVATDLAEMKVKVLKSRKGARMCEANDFASLHWVAQLTDSGKVVEDTKQKFGEWHPVQLSIGNYNDIKCFDLALPQGHDGDTLEITCPAHLAYNTREMYSHFGSDKIPLRSAIKFTV